MIVAERENPVARRDLSADHSAAGNALPARLFAKRMRAPLQAIYALPAPSVAIDDVLVRMAHADRARNIIA